jgi:hypothetical protein
VNEKGELGCEIVAFTDLIPSKWTCTRDLEKLLSGPFSYEPAALLRMFKYILTAPVFRGCNITVPDEN